MAIEAVVLTGQRRALYKVDGVANFIHSALLFGFASVDLALPGRACSAAPCRPSTSCFHNLFTCHQGTTSAKEAPLAINLNRVELLNGDGFSLLMKGSGEQDTAVLVSMHIQCLSFSLEHPLGLRIRGDLQLRV